MTMCENRGDADPHDSIPLGPKDHLQAVEKPTSTTATTPVGLFTAGRLGIYPAHGFRGGVWGWGQRGGTPSLPSVNAMLPAGVASGLLAANRALAVLALADASGYNWEPETSPSCRMEQGRAEIGVLGWEFPSQGKSRA